MSSFYRKIKYLRIYRPMFSNSQRYRGERVDRSIRLYCEQAGVAWNLQIRGPLGIGACGLKDGKTDIIANATLHREDLEALRDEISSILGSQAE